MESLTDDSLGGLDEQDPGGMERLMKRMGNEMGEEFGADGAESSDLQSENGSELDDSDGL